MAVDGVRSLYVETHNFGKTAAFWKSLGFEHFLDLGGSSGGFRAGDGGAYLFIEEVGPDAPLHTEAYFNIVDSAAIPEDCIAEPLEDTHWGTKLMSVRDPDGRTWKLEDAGQTFPNYT